MKKFLKICQHVRIITPDVDKKSKKGYVQYGLKCALVRKWPSMLQLG